MIKKVGNTFYLHTIDHSYVMQISETSHLINLHYGLRLDERDETTYLMEKIVFPPGNVIAYHKDHPTVSMEIASLEISGYGKGDIREAFIEVCHHKGYRTVDFKYQKYQISQGVIQYQTLPRSHGKEDEVETLSIYLRDELQNLQLILDYTVYEKCNVITKSCRLINQGEKETTIHKIMSQQLDLAEDYSKITHFSGAWAREMEKKVTTLRGGHFINDSVAGTSSSRANPFVILSEYNIQESYGACYGFNVVYSGNHYTSISKNSFGKTRVLSGINPKNFQVVLGPEETFETPEAVLSFSQHGLAGLTQQFHDFIRKHIVRGFWQYKERPILVNSWEAFYFKFNEAKLLKLAKIASEVGIELFVLDDGWFGKRDNDQSSLGDWRIYDKKLPSGLDGLSKKINGLGMDFGIWVEPEMVNEDSDYYRAHPEHVLAIPNHEHALGRNQMLLDLNLKEVQEYIIESMTQVFSSGNISYIKWDMNRIFSDVFSTAYPSHQQGQSAHGYVVGLYRILKELTTRFPEILFESCASGGNRYDLGMLCYMPQIWASDNSDAHDRFNMQTNYSYGYPQSVLGAHVSALPNHQTLRNVPKQTRFHVAMFGLLGYELNLTDLSKEALEEIKEEIAIYKQWRKVLQWGKFYRLEEVAKSSPSGWMVVSEDLNQAIAMIKIDRVVASNPVLTLKCKGLNPNQRYRVSNRPMQHDIRIFGDLINHIAPVHIKQDAMLHQVIAKFKKITDAEEGYTLYGKNLMNGTLKLKQGFCGTGHNEDIRVQQDDSSYVFFIEAI